MPHSFDLLGLLFKGTASDSERENTQWALGEGDDEAPVLLFFDNDKLEWVEWDGGTDQPKPPQGWHDSLKERLYSYGIDQGDIDPWDETISPDDMDELD